MPARPFNEADVTFTQDMIQHHRQAIQMAAMAADRAESQQFRQLAAGIQSAQGPEIEIMSEWLRSWENVPEDKSQTPGMEHEEASMGHMPGPSMGHMPGIMTQEQMKELMSASGTEFDHMFLSMMIAHHDGAIEMSRTEQADGVSQEAIELAARIETHQTAEIGIMRTLLNS